MSRGTIPNDPNLCRYCREAFPPFALKGTPCDDHKGPDGRPAAYEGPKLYKPGEWVQLIMATAYRAYDPFSRCSRTWQCFGYDPRAGFWMRTTDLLGPEQVTNISERAIGRTWIEL